MLFADPGLLGRSTSSNEAATAGRHPMPCHLSPATVPFQFAQSGAGSECPPRGGRNVFSCALQPTDRLQPQAADCPAAAEGSLWPDSGSVQPSVAPASGGTRLVGPERSRPRPET